MTGEFERIAAAIPDTLLIADRSGSIVWSNPQVEALLGYTAEEIIGQPVEILMDIALREAHVHLRDSFMKNPELRPMGYTRVLNARAKDGQPVPVDIELAPIEWFGNTCVLAVLRSKAWQLEQERELHNARDILERSQAITRIGSWDWNVQTGTLFWSDQVYRIFGLEREAFAGNLDAFMALVHEDDRDAVHNTVTRALTQGRPYQIKHRIKRPDGGVRYVMERGKVYRDRLGNAVQLVGTVQDVTNEHMGEARLKLADAMFRFSCEGALTTDSRFTITSANPASDRIGQYAGPGMTGLPLADLIPAIHQASVSKSLSSIGYWSGETECRRSNGVLFPALVSIAAVEQPQSGPAECYVVTISDISTLKQHERQLKQLAFIDRLTKLANRTFFIRKVESLIQNQEDGAREFALLYIDLDGFKEINDTQGHSEGDQVLFEVGKKLKEICPGNTLVGRLGGDEFGIILESSDPQAIEALATSLVEGLSIRQQYGDCTFWITGSVGIALYPRDGQEVFELIKNADVAMYQAKGKGKNQFRYFDPEISRRKQLELQMISDLATGIQQDIFELFYQPKVVAGQPQLFTVEALLRWRNSAGSYTPPSDFIPVAEQTGQIVAIGQQSFRKACRFIRDWQDREGCAIHVSFNLSSRQLYEPGVVVQLQDIMQEEGVDPSCLEFEITETIVMDDIEVAQEVLSGLRAIGARVAIDDFGTGYSSLSYLTRLPVNTVKIDREFVKKIPGTRKDRSICTAVISMAHSLDMEVVAEGVETVEQRDFLTQLGCDQMQGYLFSKPVPAGQLRAVYDEATFHSAVKLCRAGDAAVSGS